MVITQSREIQRYLDSYFMGESQLKNGRSFYTVQVKDEVVKLRFSRNGRARVVERIPNFQDYLFERAYEELKVDYD